MRCKRSQRSSEPSYMAADATTESQTDRAFARFCRTGDAQALAEVFDRTAPRLALLAGHLVPGDAHAIEDLVQTTFVEAMRSAPRFTPGRAVLPWLVTILGRRAANWRRDRGRRASEALPEVGDASLDPARLVEDRELAGRVAATIDGLAAPYREVLALRLVHALSPVEIARALDRPLGTVHSQLQRGNERLRRLLAPGVALALANVLSAGDGMAAVRAQVLAAAREVAVMTPAGVGLLGGVLMYKKGLLLAAVLAAATMLIFVRPAPAPATPLIDGSGVAPLTGATGTATMAATDESAPAANPQRIDLPPVETEAVTFRGRVVLAESGVPLAAADVEAVLRAPWPDDPPPTDGVAPPPLTTGSDGRYEIALVPREDLFLTIKVRATGRATMVADFDKLRPGIVIDSGDVPMIPGADLSLRVADERGEPIAAFGIQLQGPREALRSTDGSFFPWGWNGMQRTGADGIAGPRSVPVGEWRVQFAEGTGHRFAGPWTFAVPANRTSLVVDLPVTTPDLTEAIAGTVVDEYGTPLVGVEVAAEQAGSLRDEESFGGGRFHIPGLRAERGPVRLARVGPRMGDRGREYEVLAPREPILPGTRDVRVIARRLAKLETTIRIVDGRDRSPVEGFRYRSHPIEHDQVGSRLDKFGSASLQLPRSQRHAGGLVQIENLLPFDHLLVIVPDDPDLQPVLFHEFDPRTAGDVVEVTLRPAVRWRVRVTDRTGKPIAGSTVQLLRGVGRTKVTRHGYTQTWEGALDDGISGSYLAIATATGTTDANGIATLRTAADVDGCALRVRGARHLEYFVGVAETVTDGHERTIVVEPAARIVGRLEPPGLVAAFGPSAEERAAAARHVDAAKRLRRIEIELEQQTERRAYRATAIVDDDGAFTFDALPPGDHALQIDPPGLPGTVELSVIRALRAGEERTVTLDLHVVQPARLTGTVLVNGTPPPPESRLDVRNQNVALDAAGRFETSLLPGPCECTLHVPGATLQYPTPVLVEAATTLDTTLDFAHRRVDVHVTDRAGAPIARKWIELHRLDDEGRVGPFSALLILDQNGRATAHGSWHDPCHAVLWLDPPPRGPITGEPPGRSVALGRIEVPDGELDASYEFIIDAGKR